MIHETAFIHPLAHVQGATVGARTRIWQFASVIRGAVLGADCTVASGACFDGSRAGDRTILSHNLAAGPGFWLGDDVFIGPNCTLCNDAWPRSVKDGFDPSRFDGKHWAIVIEHGVTVGAGSTILPGIVLGEGCMIAAGSVVAKDVPEGALWKDNRISMIPDEARMLARRMRFAGERSPTR
ncbi:MAG: N-acetyltransferase [Caulobacteraceae bacterium]|nr:N-acetyltransferase [Caulobacteraceae bacterium]